MSTLCIPHTQLRSLVAGWLAEDAPNFDFAGHIVGSDECEALLLCKRHETADLAECYLAGVPFFQTVFTELGCTVEWMVREGEQVVFGQHVASVRGPINRILLGERTALNALARASGVASLARHFVKIAKANDWTGQVAGTRKTTPSFRLVEKYALLVGGAATHRMDLSSMIMLKDNHVWYRKDLQEAIHETRRLCGFSSKIEVECRSLQEAVNAANAGADVIMFDNFAPAALQEAAAVFKRRFPGVVVEASGGIQKENFKSFLLPNVDVISMSCLTQGYPVVDFSLKIKTPDRDPLNPIVCDPK